MKETEAIITFLKTQSFTIYKAPAMLSNVMTTHPFNKYSLCSSEFADGMVCDMGPQLITECRSLLVFFRADSRGLILSQVGAKWIFVEWANGQGGERQNHMGSSGEALRLSSCPDCPAHLCLCTHGNARVQHSHSPREAALGVLLGWGSPIRIPTLTEELIPCPWAFSAWREDLNTHGCSSLLGPP